MDLSLFVFISHFSKQQPLKYAKWIISCFLFAVYPQMYTSLDYFDTGENFVYLQWKLDIMIYSKSVHHAEF